MIQGLVCLRSQGSGDELPTSLLTSRPQADVLKNHPSTLFYRVTIVIAAYRRDLYHLSCLKAHWEVLVQALIQGDSFSHFSIQITSSNGKKWADFPPLWLNLDWLRVSKGSSAPHPPILSEQACWLPSTWETEEHKVTSEGNTGCRQKGEAEGTECFEATGVDVKFA